MYVGSSKKLQGKPWNFGQVTDLEGEREGEGSEGGSEGVRSQRDRTCVRGVLQEAAGETLELRTGNILM